MTAEIIDIQPYLDQTLRKGDIIEIEGIKYRVLNDNLYGKIDGVEIELVEE